MEVADFVKLPAAEAGEMYQKQLHAGHTSSASILHQAYYEAHRVRLSDGRQISDAMSQPTRPRAAAPATLKRERSTIRFTGVIIWIIGLALVVLAAASGGGFGGVLLTGGLTTVGFTLWLVGIIEDRLIDISRAVTSAPRSSAAGEPRDI